MIGVESLTLRWTQSLGSAARAQVMHGSRKHTIYRLLGIAGDPMKPIRTWV